MFAASSNAFRSLYKDLETAFYPLIWFETTTSIAEDPDMAADLRLAARLEEAIPITGWIAFAIGIVLCGVGTYLIWRYNA